MKVVFVIDNIYFEHLGIMTLSSILKKAGYDVDVALAEYNSIKSKLANNSFTLLAYSAYSFVISHFLKLNRKIKEEFNVFSVFGGPHPTHFSEFINEPGVDGVCIGEGDYALLDLANNLTEDKPITNIANWWIKQNQEVFRNPARPLIKDLDTLPFADRAIFPIYYAAVVLTARGCPYKCSFCQPRTEFRRRNVDNVIEELREIKTKTNVRFIYFVDMTFNISSEWLDEFSEKYRRQIGLPFHCRIRADLVTRENTESLKDAGCFSVGMGIETANDYLRNKILNKGITKEQILSASKVIKEYKIKLLTFNMIGIPLGSLKDDLDTLRLGIKCKPDYAKVEPIFIYKDTQIHNFLINDQRFKHLEVPEQDNYYIFWKPKGYSYNIRKIINLNQLFSLTVEFPFILPLVPFLIRLPLRRLYAFLFLIWTKYCLNFRIWGGNILGWRNFYIELLKGIKKFHPGVQLIQQVDG